MVTKFYTRPAGLLYGAVAKRAIDDGWARPLAGSTTIAFSGLAQWNRSSGLALRPLSIDQAATDRLSAERSVPNFVKASSTDKIKSPPWIMGIVNVTPDSFSDGGCYRAHDKAVEHALTIHQQGADIIDIGGESTRPGATPVGTDEEMERVLPVIEALSKHLVPVSVDTRNADVMAASIKAGAMMINDVSALEHDVKSLSLVNANKGAMVGLMHMVGTPSTMQSQAHYDNVVLDVYDYLERRINVCMGAGIDRSRLIIDPGIGFAKTVKHNRDILRAISLYHFLGYPILLGLSRKRFIAGFSRDEPADKRLPGSLAAALVAVGQGVQIIRVHDVAETRQALDIWQQIMA